MIRLVPLSLYLGLATVASAIAPLWSIATVTSEDLPSHYRSVATALPEIAAFLESRAANGSKPPERNYFDRQSAFVHEAQWHPGLPAQDLPSVNPIRLPLRYPPSFSGWVPYWDFSDALAAVSVVGGAIPEIDLFGYHFGADHRVIPATSQVANALASLSQPGRKPGRLLVTVVNDVVTPGQPSLLKDPNVIHERLATPESRRLHVEELLTLSQTADGIEIDYENLRLEDREAFSAFIQELAEQLHQREKFLSVVVEPRTNDVLRNGPGVIDWRAIGAYADRVKIMGYFFHFPGGTPGAIAPMSWLEQVTRYALQNIPEKKLNLSLTLSGIDWPAGGRGSSVDFAQAMDLATRYQATIERDADQTPFFRYNDGQVQHEVWFEDAQSILAKRSALQRAGIRQIGLWHLGAGDSELWRRLAEPPAGWRTRPPRS